MDATDRHDLPAVPAPSPTPAVINVPTDFLPDELWHRYVCLCSTCTQGLRSRCLIDW